MFGKKEREKYDTEIARLKHEIEDLKQIIKTQELIKLREENARLKEKEQLISKIKFRLKDVAFLAEEGIVLVKYNIPNVKVQVSAEGKVLKNDFFYAVNKLQLIPFEDMKKISAVIDNIKVDK